MGEVTTFVQHLYNGVAIGAVYGLIALAITLVYGLSRIIHFAVGEFLMIGALVAWATFQSTTSFLLAFIAALVATVALGLTAERTMFRFTYNEPTAGFIVSLGLIILLQNFAVEVWGSDGRSVVPPIQDVLNVGGVIIRGQTLANVGIALGALAACYAVLERTRLGKSLRAVADDREAAALMGIPVRTTILVTFLISSALIAVSGWIVLTISTVSPFVGLSFALRGFAIALIGGLGNIKGAAAAGLLLGMAESVAAGYFDPGWRDVYVFGFVVLVLLVRPTGIGRGVEGAKL